jgi:hypothetical protein
MLSTIELFDWHPTAATNNNAKALTTDEEMRAILGLSGMSFTSFVSEYRANYQQTGPV